MVFNRAGAAGILQCLIAAAIVCLPTAARAERPVNVVWISAEDISADTLGCYGGPAHTPRLDALAAGGLRFDAAFSAAPVCAPSRSAIITGVMPTTLGSLPMRCRATPPPFVVGLPKLLRDAGYFCTNNVKTDYNFERSFDAGWHASSGKAHWRNRPDAAQPFFAVFNFTVTHESGLFGDKAAEPRRQLPPEARRRAGDVRVPPYYPDTPVIRESLAVRQELAAALDREVGRVLDELAADGLADDTIVFFWGDHGEGIPHGKRSLTEHGLRVPLVVHVPDRFAGTAVLPGGGPARGATGTLVSLMDLGPTVLDLAGATIPAWMEGRSFLGPHATARDVVLGARDRMDAAPGFGRTARDARFRYVRNFLPWIGGDDLPDYATGVPITGELRRVRAAGTLPAGAGWFARTSRPPDELRDAVADPDEIHDLATDPARQADLERLREAVRGWMRSTRDTGILPEPLLRREAASAGSEWAIFHPGEAEDAAAMDRYDAILAAAWAVAEGQPTDSFATRLADRDPAVRYWAVCGTGWAAMRAGAAGRGPSAAALAPVLADPEPTVRIAAAGWLLRCGDSTGSGAAIDVLSAEMRADDPEVRLAALVTIDEVGPAARSLWEAAAALALDKDEEYSRRTVERIRGKLRAVLPARGTN